jgi:glycosyltransferase involved in cell wall biosynthesis
MHPLEQEEAPTVYCVKAEPKARVLAAVLAFAFANPMRFCRGLRCAAAYARSLCKPFLYTFYYCAEAILVGAWMKRMGVGHLHASFTTTIAVLVTRLFPITMSFAAHGIAELYDPHKVRLSEKIAASLFVRSVSQHGVGQMMLASPPEQWDRLLHIPLGIDPAAFPARRTRSSATFDLLTVGRLSAEKGHRILFWALARLGERARSVRLYVSGDGPEGRVLEKEVARLGLGQVVEFLGWVEQTRLSELHGKMSAFVMASLYEGIPIALMEAMATGLPCVVPAINGIPELVEHGRTGLLFRPADVEDLVQCLRRLMDDSAFAAELGRAARQRTLGAHDIFASTESLAKHFPGGSASDGKLA